MCNDPFVNGFEETTRRLLLMKGRRYSVRQALKAAVILNGLLRLSEVRSQAARLSLIRLARAIAVVCRPTLRKGTLHEGVQHQRQIQSPLVLPHHPSRRENSNVCRIASWRVPC